VLVHRNPDPLRDPGWVLEGLEGRKEPTAFGVVMLHHRALGHGAEAGTGPLPTRSEPVADEELLETPLPSETYGDRGVFIEEGPEVT